MSSSGAVEGVRAWLGWEAGNVGPLEALERSSPPPGFWLPEEAEILTLLERLGVPPSARSEIAGGSPTPEATPEAWWLLERLHGRLTDHSGSPSPPPWPAPQPGEGALSRYFHIYVFLAAVPDLLKLHGRRGVPAEITWATMADLGPQVKNHVTRKGYSGFDGAFWMWDHFRGDVFRIGRLQYAAGEELEIHIPADGALTPRACDASLEAAGEFFRDHFPERSYDRGWCTSWLLDPQLRQYLAPGSNILAFQDRFEMDPVWSACEDEAVVKYVFGYFPQDLVELPQSSSLQRAVVGHLQAGGHWEFRKGWVPL